MRRQDRFDQAILALHDAALGDGDWHVANAALQNACFADASHIGIVSAYGGNSAEFAFSKVSSRILDPGEAEREYVYDFYPTDERIPRLLRLPNGRIAPNTDLYSAVERRRTSGTWNDFLCRLGTTNQLNVRLDGPDGSDILWALTRHFRSPDWGEEDLKVVRSLLPHFLHAVLVRQTLAAAEALGTSLAGQLDNPLLAVMLLDQQGKIVQASTKARQILCERDGLSDRGGVLSANLGTDNTGLAKLLACAIPRFGMEPTGGSIRVERPSCLPPFTLRVHPIGVRNGDCGGRRAVAVVWIVDPAAKTQVAPRSLEELLGLTAAQSRVAAALAEGRTVREVAVSQGISEGTVRWHLKGIFARTGCSGQSDLLRLVLSVAQVP